MHGWESAADLGLSKCHHIIIHRANYVLYENSDIIFQVVFGTAVSGTETVAGNYILNPSYKAHMPGTVSSQQLFLRIISTWCFCYTFTMILLRPASFQNVQFEALG